MGCKDKPQACTAASGSAGELVEFAGELVEWEAVAAVCEEINFLIFNRGYECVDKIGTCRNRRNKQKKKGKDLCDDAWFASDCMATCGHCAYSDGVSRSCGDIMDIYEG